MPRLAEKSRVVKDCGFRNGNAKLFSNTCIAIGEIVAVFGETVMMMIAFITIKSSLVPFIEGLCAKI